MLDLGAYEPALLKDSNGSILYTLKKIGDQSSISEANLKSRENAIGDFRLWVSCLYYYAYHSIQAVREAWCPSAMVDGDGNLFTLTFHSFTHTQKGPQFKIARYNADGLFTESIQYFWSDYGVKVYPFEYQPHSINAGDNVAKMVSSHNLYSPVIAQETFPSNVQGMLKIENISISFAYFHPLGGVT